MITVPVPAPGQSENAFIRDPQSIDGKGRNDMKAFFVWQDV
jgi:hypothetical protein